VRWKASFLILLVNVTVLVNHWRIGPALIIDQYDIWRIPWTRSFSLCPQHSSFLRRTTIRQPSPRCSTYAKAPVIISICLSRTPARPRVRVSVQPFRSEILWNDSEFLSLLPVFYRRKATSWSSFGWPVTMFSGKLNIIIGIELVDSFLENCRSTRWTKCKPEILRVVLHRDCFEVAVVSSPKFRLSPVTAH